MTSTSPGIFVERALTWVRSAYPDGVPSTDRSGLRCVLEKRLTSDEMGSLMMAMPEMAPPVPPTSEAMLAVVTEVPSLDATSMDMYRVAGRLASAGWPLAEVA